MVARTDSTIVLTIGKLKRLPFRSISISPGTRRYPSLFSQGVNAPMTSTTSRMVNSHLSKSRSASRNAIDYTGTIAHVVILISGRDRFN